MSLTYITFLASIFVGVATNHLEPAVEPAETSKATFDTICSPFFRCARTTQRGFVTCIPANLRCNTVDDCADGSDETDCDKNGTSGNRPVTEAIESNRTGTIAIETVSRSKKCGVSAFKPVTENKLRIVNGNIAIHGSWPWQVNLYYRGEQLCGGTLIRDDVVLTAAHCFENGKDRFPRAWNVIIGDQDITVAENTEQSVRVSKIVRHAKYNSNTVAFDITLLKLQRPFKRNNYANIACMPAFDTLKEANRLRKQGEQMYCNVTGFGDTMDTFGEGLLKQAKVPIVKPRVCNSAAAYDGYINRKQLCAGFKEGAHDSCQGDSGGPLVCLNVESSQWEVHGIVSFGDGCAKKNKYGVYTSVYRMRKWINNKLNFI